MVVSFEAFRVLWWLAGGPDSPRPPDELCPKPNQRAVYDELAHAGLVRDTLTDGDINFNFVLSERGQVEARNVAAVYRVELAQRRVLEWLRTSSDLDGLLGSDLAADYSGRLTEEEINEAAEELEDLRLVKGRKLADGTFFFVETTPAGKRALRGPSPISGRPPGPMSVTTTSVAANNYGNQTIGNQNIGGAGAVMSAEVTQNQGISLTEAVAVLEQLRSAILAAPGVDPAGRDEVVAEVDGMIRKASKYGLSWLKKAAVAFSDEVAAVCGPAMADQFLPQITG